MVDDPDEIAVDEFTWAEIEVMVTDSVVPAICTECGMYYTVEPDANEYDCVDSCEAKGTVSSPLIKLGLI